MRRCLTILVLLIVLPVQWVWGSAAPYCQHEADPGHGWHFGHHQHQHKAGDASAKSGASAGAGSIAIDHVDCEACHLVCSAPLPPNGTAGPNGPATQSVPEPLLDYRSYIPRTPERPDRPATTPAVRSGGGVVSDSIPFI